MFFKKKKLPTADSDLLDQLSSILFPPLKLEENDGTKFHIDYSVDSNLDAVLMDLQDGNNDAVAQNTISKVIVRLNKARKLLEAYPEIHPEAKYIMVDDIESDRQVEAIEDGSIR
jgi:hypothetical protein